MTGDAEEFSSQGGADYFRARAEIAEARYCAEFTKHAVTLGELAEVKQAAWDAYKILGFDTDGDETPHALTYPPFPEFVRQFATEARRDHDEACEDLWAAEERIEAVKALHVDDGLDLIGDETCCRECGVGLPCPTLAVLSAAPRLESARPPLSPWSVGDVLGPISDEPDVPPTAGLRKSGLRGSAVLASPEAKR